MEVNPEDLTDSLGDRHTYWLLAIEAARVAKQIACGLLLTDGTDYG